MSIGETVSRAFGRKKPVREARVAVERAEKAQREVEELQSAAMSDRLDAETQHEAAETASVSARNQLEIASDTNRRKRSEWDRTPTADATEQEARGRERSRQDGEMAALQQVAQEQQEAAVLADSDRLTKQSTEAEIDRLLEAVTAEVESARAAAAAAEQNGNNAEAKRKAEEANAAATRAEEIRTEASALQPSDTRITVGPDDGGPPRDAPAGGFYSQLGRNFLGACGRTGDRHLGFMFRNGNYKKPSAWGGLAGTAASAVNTAAMVFAITNAELYSAGELDEAEATNFLTSLGIGAAAGAGEALGLPSAILGCGVSLFETLGRAGGHLAGRTEDSSVTAVDWFHDHADSFNASAITQFGVGAAMLGGDTHLATDFAVPAALGLATTAGGIHYQDRQAERSAAEAEAHQSDTSNERANPATGAPMIELPLSSRQNLSPE
jgi:chemotaxis protein histidine kinase CheA